LISDGFDLTKGKTYLYGSPTTISSALIPFYQASWPSINGITCFNRHGCQEGDEPVVDMEEPYSMPTSKHGACNHFSSKEKVQIQ